MQDAGAGLTAVPTSDLKALYKALHRGDVPCPLNKSTLMSMGLNRIAENGSLLSGLDERALRSILVCVIAERIHPGPRGLG